MQTLVIPLIPELPKLLNTNASNASWVITATLLVAAVATPVVGRLGDMYGPKRLLIACAMAEMRLIDVLRDVAIMLMPMLVVLVMIILWPQVVLFLPSLISPEFLN